MWVHECEWRCLFAIYVRRLIIATTCTLHSTECIPHKLFLRNEMLCKLQNSISCDVHKLNQWFAVSSQCTLAHVNTEPRICIQFILMKIWLAIVTSINHKYRSILCRYQTWYKTPIFSILENENVRLFKKKWTYTQQDANLTNSASNISDVRLQSQNCMPVFPWISSVFCSFISEKVHSMIEVISKS